MVYMAYLKVGCLFYLISFFCTSISYTYRRTRMTTDGYVYYHHAMDWHLKLWNLNVYTLNTMFQILYGAIDIIVEKICLSWYTQVLPDITRKGIGKQDISIQQPCNKMFNINWMFKADSTDTILNQRFILLYLLISIISDLTHR